MAILLRRQKNLNDRDQLVFRGIPDELEIENACKQSGIAFRQRYVTSFQDPPPGKDDSKVTVTFG